MRLEQVGTQDSEATLFPDGSRQPATGTAEGAQLHDRTVRRLQLVAIAVHGAIPAVGDDAAVRLYEAVEELDTAVREIQSAVFLAARAAARAVTVDGSARAADIDVRDGGELLRRADLTA